MNFDCPYEKTETCSQCGRESCLPVLWTSWNCYFCGAYNLAKLDFHASLAREILLWAKQEPDDIGLSFGHPGSIPREVLGKLTKECGYPPTFIGLNRKFRWDCINCGKCCREALNTTKEHFARLGPFDSQLLFGNETMQRLPLSPETKACVFLDQKEKETCSIYFKRPSFCRLFPLGLLGVDNGIQRQRFLIWTKSNCPGIGKGKVWVVRDFLRASGILQLLRPKDSFDYSSDL